MVSSLVLAITCSLTWLAKSAKPSGFYVLNPEDYAANLKDDLEWATDNVPFIDVPELPDLQTAFYYRWTMYRKHIKPTPDGWVITEFLPDVKWAGKYNTIPAAAGHHIMEGRWIHNASYLNDYITFWFRRGGRPRTYTAWFAWATLNRQMVVNNGSFITDVFPDLLANARAWKNEHLGDYNGRKCYWQNDGHDAMEVSISGSGCRPTIESVMHGEAVALLAMMDIAGIENASLQNELTQMRESTRQVVLEQMWNPTIESFAVIPLGAPKPPPSPPPPVPEGFEVFNHGKFCCDQKHCQGGHSAFLFEGAADLDELLNKCKEFGDRCHYVTSSGSYGMVAEYCNTTNPYSDHPERVTTYRRKSTRSSQLLDGGLVNGAACPGNGTAKWTLNETVSVRELLAFMPWYFSVPSFENSQLIPPSRAHTYMQMWRQLFDPQGFQAKWGLRSAELRSPCYNYSWSHHDCWNGPSWPYETARVLTGAANLLNDYPSQNVFDVQDYIDLLKQYAEQHTRTYARDDTAKPLGSGHVFEVVHPDEGYWIDRQSGTHMGDDYNHSTFIDLILTGLFGLRPRPDSTVVLNPLVPLGLLTHFAVDNVLYHGRYLSIVWDNDGTHYKRGAGLTLFVDGKVGAHAQSLQKLTVNLDEIVLV